MRIAEKRILEWWEAPGVEGREAFDEEIVYLNERAESLGLPRWAVRVRDLMPRWGFEPCSHRFFDGLEQVMAMIGAGKPGPRLGGCGDVPLAVHLRLHALGREFLAWAGGREARELGPLLGARTPAKAEAARAVGEALTAFGRGWVATDAVLEAWAERAAHPLTRRLLDGEEAPLPKLLRCACAYNVLGNVRRLAQGLGAAQTPDIRVCQAALAELPQAAPERLEQLWAVLQALVRWLKREPPQDTVQAHLYALLGEHDPVREWLVASLYKSLKLWQVHIDRLLGQKRRLFSLI
ncbi:MAG: hypothetical protein NZ924_05720 [Candidatus Bipolaricaulota bacterium]|nr:hypothetical protein [Candidatus Bipolaricaulota bacterium]MDW8152386.1 hypothetical protein [Candidatus Bipolaricaulota bacterium]